MTVSNELHVHIMYVKRFEFFLSPIYIPLYIANLYSAV